MKNVGYKEYLEESHFMLILTDSSMNVLIIEGNS